mmetsp:Transcript_28068/g.43856  ORF Transcript_28068/g.43856 Transcript_28068/m.43856 type:complete len:546 (+) Transcript_28068:91-1728(+)
MEDRHSWRRSQASRSPDRGVGERWKWRAEGRSERQIEIHERRGRGTEAPRRKRQREISPWLARSQLLDKPNGGRDAPNTRRAKSSDSPERLKAEKSLSRDQGGGLVLRARSAVAERGPKRRKSRRNCENDGDDNQKSSELNSRGRRRASREEHGKDEDEHSKANDKEQSANYGYGASKPSGETKPKKSTKTKATGFGYGASKLVANEGSESGSEYTSDDSSDDDSSDDVVSETREAQGDENNVEEVASPCASRASLASQSENSKDSSAEDDSDVPESLGEGETAEAAGTQNWLASADGEAPRARSKAAPRRIEASGAKLDDHESTAKAGEDELDSLAIDPYIDPYMDASSENQAIATDMGETTVESRVESCLQAPETNITTNMAEDQGGNATSSSAVVDPYLLDADVGSGSRSENHGLAVAKTSKRSRWRRRVTWQPPPLLILPETHDVVLGYDLERSKNTPESRARQQRRGERSQNVVPAKSDDLDGDKAHGYLAKCQKLMETLEEGEPIVETVQAFWNKLDATERERFSREFPEIAQYAIKKR